MDVEALKKDIKSFADATIKWFKERKNQKAIAMYLVVIILLYFDFAYWAGHIEVTGELSSTPPPVETNVTEESNYTLEKVVVYDDTGSAGRGSPMGLSTKEIPFTIGENAKAIYVNLTCENPRQRTDYDLNVYYPDGKNAGSSAGPSYEESVPIVAKGNKTLPAGDYTAEIVFWFNTLGTTWHLTVEAIYLVENDTCPPGGCPV